MTSVGDALIEAAREQPERLQALKRDPRTAGAAREIEWLSHGSSAPSPHEHRTRRRRGRR